MLCTSSYSESDFSDTCIGRKRSRRDDENYDQLYHKNAIKNREAIAARSQKRSRLNHSDQPTAAQTVAGTHPMGTGNQMDIEPILDRNTNDNLVPAKFKSDQVKTDCEK